MANQYSGSLEHKVQERFNCTAEELLRQLAEEGLSYMEAEKRIGVTHGTIRKWARRYDIILRPNEPEDVLKEEQERMKKFFAKELNVHNFLSRSWTVIS